MLPLPCRPLTPPPSRQGDCDFTRRAQGGEVPWEYSPKAVVLLASFCGELREVVMQLLEAVAWGRLGEEGGEVDTLELHLVEAVTRWREENLPWGLLVRPPPRLLISSAPALSWACRRP